MSRGADSQDPQGAADDRDGCAGLDAPILASLLGKIESATVRVGIIGLGYVGLPLARAFSEHGVAVLGFDVDPVKVARLEHGRAISVISPTWSLGGCGKKGSRLQSTFVGWMSRMS